MSTAHSKKVSFQNDTTHQPLSNSQNDPNPTNTNPSQTSIVNPHNPEFLTKRPWYLGGDTATGPSLDHQTDQRPETEKLPLTLQTSEQLLALQREKLARDQQRLQFRVGMWVEALRRNKPPFVICQILKIANKGTLFDVRYEDGSVERNVYMNRQDRGTAHARIRWAGAGNRVLPISNTDTSNSSITSTSTRHLLIHHIGKETYDSKRDQYHGYDTGHAYMQRMQDKFGLRETLRHQIRSEQKSSLESNSSPQKQPQTHPSSNQHSDSDSDNSDYDSDRGGSSDSEEEFVQHDKDAKVHVSRLARQGGVGGAEMKVTARNLRIREDTAKYLRNLDPNSAFYDPKSRSMRDNPNPERDPAELPFVGDNFARISGDAIALAKTQVYAWDLAQQSSLHTTEDPLQVIHPQANPSQAELLRKQHETVQVDTRKQRQQHLLDKYGGTQYLDPNKNDTSTNTNKTSSETIQTVSEDDKTRFGVQFKEEIYSRDGNVLRRGTGGMAASTLGASSAGQKYIPLKSKYEEDVFIHGHTTVFGSYFHKGAFRWGYADDHSLLRNSYCTGINGRIANDEANEWKYGTGSAGSAALAQAKELLKSIPSSQPRNIATKPMDSKLYGEADPTTVLDPAKVRAALQKQRQEEEKQAEMKKMIFTTDQAITSTTSRNNKRSYNSGTSIADVTPEDMEAYRLTKKRGEDPMAY